MKKILLITLLIINIAVYGQSNNTATRVSTSIEINVNKIDAIKSDMDILLLEKNIVSTNYSINRTSFNINLSTDSIGYHLLLNSIRKWGFVISENTTSNDNSNELSIMVKEIDLLKKEKQQYEKLVSKIDTVGPYKYFEYHEKIISIDKLISEKEIKITTSKAIGTNFSLKIKFVEDEAIGSDYSDLWVNMPGFEYSFLFTEQPTSGSSPNSMIGYNLKYIVNHKKTYVLLGLYKSQEQNDPSTVNEMYMFSLGQDFYSRKLGRGQRKFFNLYTSFNLGVYVSSSELTKSSSWFVNPFIGLELFKTKNIRLCRWHKRKLSPWLSDF